jgi:type IV secretion system protein VirB10
MTALPPLQTPSPKVSADSLLGAPRRPITRYRPAVLAGGLLVVLLLVGLGFAIAFGGSHRSRSAAPAAEVERPEAPPTPDLKGAPISYADSAAQPGGPGSLSLADTAGAASAAPAGASGAPVAPPAPTPEQQHYADQARSAHEGGPFFGVPANPVGAAADAVSAAGLPVAVAPAAPPPAAPALSAKQQFAAGAKIAEDYAAGVEQEPRSPHEVKAGSIIPAALVTGLNSDLPGEVIAQVTETVYDHVSGQTVLIPQGARLIGQYDSQASYGQNRVLLVWNRLIFPDGRSINIGTMTGTDLTGASGLSDRVDTHLPVLLRAVGLSTLITVGGAVAQNAAARSSGNLVLEDSAGGVSQSASQVGDRFIDRDLARQPTLMVRPGFRVNVLVSRDLVLEPYVAPR